MENACKVATFAPPVSISSSERTCILVLGAHRSGTSAITRMMNLLGADLASGLMPALPDNPKGYWESTELMGIHEELLAGVSSQWDDWRPFSIAAESEECRERFFARLSEWLDREFRTSQLFLVKDPRICRFVPLWLEVLQSFSCEPRVVLPLRHPFEVAESLYARDGIPLSKGCLLWLRHVLDAERATRYIPRVWVHYDDLLHDWPAIAKHTAQRLGFSWPTSPEEAAAEVSTFLSADLRHHFASAQELNCRSDVVGWVRRTYSALTTLVADGPTEPCWQELDQIRTEFDDACLAFGELIEAEREDSAEQALKGITVVSRSEFDKRIGGLESRLANFEAFMDDGSVAAIAKESFEGQRLDGRFSSVLNGKGSAPSRGALDAIPATVERRLRQIDSQLKDDLAACQSRIDELASVTKTHEAVNSRLEADLRTVAAEQQNAMSRMEAEIAVSATGIEQLRGHVASHEMIAEALYEETRRLGEATKLISDSSSEQERSTISQFSHLRADLDAMKAGVDEMRLMWAETRTQLERLREELYQVQEDSLGQRWQRVCVRPLKRAHQRTLDALVGVITFRWLRVRLHRARLPHYRDQLLALGLFDSQWFLEQNPDVAAAGVDPLDHWLKHGVREGRDPNPEFDTEWYLARYPRVAKSGQNPLVHYLCKGSSPGINPNANFDSAQYLEQHPEVAAAGLNPLAHYLRNRPAYEIDSVEEWTPIEESPAPVEESIPTAEPLPSVESTLFEPLVTVVVPNFNHAEFLPRRLDSIYNQTYRNFRVILLDDCSSDGSREILDEYRERYSEITTCYYNETNSGGVFRQWRKGIQLASGSPLLWIAESDDYCDSDFLEKLVPSFRDEAVMLTYSSVQFVTQDGVPHPFTFRDHLNPHIDASKWSQDYVEASYREVESALAIKNTIPNVSGALLRTPSPDLALLEDESWLNMKVCGDWVLYLHLLAGGKVAHCARTNNYFRFHSSNSSGKTHRDEVYYLEHARVSEEAARLYGVSHRTLGLARQVKREYYNAMCDGDEFDRLYSAERIADAKANRRPTVMISLFSFVTGGGEIIPIRLANELKRRGYPVVVHSFDHFHDEPGIRAMLRNDIPVVRANTGEQILKIVAEVQPDVINTHHKSIQGKLLELMQEHPSVFQSARHVATMHGMFEMSEYFSEEYLDAVLPAYIESVDGWIYTADKNIKPFQDRELFAHDTFTKVANGMEAPRIRKIERSDLGIAPDAFVLCIASRAIREKGWHEAIDAVTKARLRCKRPIHLVLLGIGPVVDELSQQSLPPYIHLLGFTDDSCSYYAMSDMAILPSMFSGESFPMTLVEAIMVGKPVIASDLGEIRAMISSENGMAGSVLPLVNGKVSVDQLSEQIVHFAENAQAYEEACGVSRALAKRFDIRDIAEQYLEIFAKTSKRSTPEAHVAIETSSFPSLIDQIQQLKAMRLFDEEFYRQQYPDIADLRDPIAHYVFYGCREQRMPNDWFDFQYIRQSCSEIEQKGANPLWYYGMYLKEKRHIKTRSDMHRWGYCPVCEQQRLFLAHFDTDDSFNNLRCLGCNGAPRDRAVAILLDQHLPGWRKTARIHESSPCTPCLKMLAGDYSASHYYPDKSPGTMVNGFRNENIEQLTFEDNTFDVVAALEVIEHVFNPSEMVREMVRCTRPGGIAVFTTVPCGEPVSRPRARLHPITGEVEHFFPPIYHGNPIADGALLTWDLGLDFDDNIREWSGGAELTHWCQEDEQIAIIPGGVPHVYVLKKPEA